MKTFTRMAVATFMAILLTVAGCGSSKSAQTDGPVQHDAPIVQHDGAPAQTDGPLAQTDAGPQFDGPYLTDANCYMNPTTHVEIINACTNAQSIDKQPVLPLLLDGGVLPTLP